MVFNIFKNKKINNNFREIIIENKVKNNVENKAENKNDKKTEEKFYLGGDNHVILSYIINNLVNDPIYLDNFINDGIEDQESFYNYILKEYKLRSSILNYFHEQYNNYYYNDFKKLEIKKEIKYLNVYLRNLQIIIKTFHELGIKN